MRRETSPGGPLREGESVNMEIAHRLSEQEGQPQRSPWRWQDDVIEVVEAVLLALVVVATAWSGYQAAKWDGRQTQLYGRASTIRIQADELTTLGGQRRLLDVSTFNTWIQSKSAGRARLAALYERRFSPEYKVAFDAWLATKPFSNPDAPAGPSFMPQYVNPQIERGKTANRRAGHMFEQGTIARENSDEYVRATVLLATVLFLLALSQRFKVPRVRIGVVVSASALMIYALSLLARFPRL
jgi:hypothetical protein